MIMEVFEWLQLANVKKMVTNLNLNLITSDFILICYLLTFLTIKKGCYLAVFLLSEGIAYTGILNQLTNVTYYLFFAGIYCGLYHYLILKETKLNTIFACAIIILFNVGAALDASIYPHTETIFYQYYEYIVVGIHLYLISTTIHWRILRSTLGASVNSVSRMLGFSYHVPLFYDIDSNNKSKAHKT